MSWFARCCGYDEGSSIDTKNPTSLADFEVTDGALSVGDSGEEGCCSFFGESSYIGRGWKWLNAPGTERCNFTVRGVLGAGSIAAITTMAFFTARQFFQIERDPIRSMLFGAGFGICVTVLTGSILPKGYAGPLADWLSRWSYEGLQIATQFYLNGGCPRGHGFWDPRKVPPAVKEFFTLSFTGASASIALLSLRTLLFSEINKNDGIAIEDLDDLDGLYEQDPDPILMLESGKGNRLGFAAEQCLKVALGLGLILTTDVAQVEIPELRFFGMYLMGHFGGALAGTGYQYLRDRVLERCPVGEGTLKRIDKAGSVLSAGSYGIFFAWTDATSFIPLGLISGASKVITMHKFQLLTKNDEKVTSFRWITVDNVFKGTLAALILTWYISGMTDEGLRVQDYANIVTYLVSIIGSYPLTRYLAKNFDPGKNNRLFNTLRFYFVNHNEVLVLLYMLIRSAQSIGDNHKDTGLFAVVQNILAWASLGIAAGNNRALMGIRSEQSPNEMSSLAELTAWFILGSQGKFR